MNSDAEYCASKYTQEINVYKYQGQLRSASSRCTDHSANLRSSCAGCRAAAWMEMKTAMEQESRQEINQPSTKEETPANTDDVKPMDQVKEESIRMPNVIKSER